MPLAAPAATATPSTQQAGNSIWLPLVQTPTRPGIFGATIRDLKDETGLREAAELGLTWLRGPSIEWRGVQPIEGGPYNWEILRGVEEKLIAASGAGLTPIVMINISPRWATSVPSGCGPIKPEAFDDFAAFMTAVVERYSQPPFNIKYWEIGNEPDIDWLIVGVDAGIGCWGNIADTRFYGGDRYGEMLRAVYPAIKQADPEAQVLLGGLLLNSPSGTPGQGSPEKFLRGVLEAQKNDPQLSFDILSFHGYGYYTSSPFDPLGGFVAGKVAFLRQELAAYGRSVPMLNTETAVLCVRLTTDCREKQADYVVRIYVETMALGLLGSLWYELDSDEFYNTALIEPSTRLPRITYTTFKNTQAELGTANYVGSLPGQAGGVVAHTFARRGQTLIVAWSDQGASVRIPVPEDASIACRDRDGAPLTCLPAGNALSYKLGRSPIYFVIDEAPPAAPDQQTVTLSLVMGGDRW